MIRGDTALRLIVWWRSACTASRESSSSILRVTFNRRNVFSVLL